MRRLGKSAGASARMVAAAIAGTPRHGSPREDRMLKVATPRNRTSAPPSRARFLLLMPCTATLLRVATLAAPVALLPGCIKNWDDTSFGATPGNGSNTPMSSTSGHLPQPSRRKYPPPDLDAAGLK